MIELVHSTCPNDTFVFHAWTAGRLPGAPGVRVRHADVDEANALAAAGVGDVLKVSYGALPWLLGDYALLPAGGAVGRGCGPLVLAAGPELPAGARVAVPGERTTAYLLFRLWAAAYRLSVHVVPFPQIMPAVRDGAYDAGLVIHEARFTYPAYGLHCLADLGAWWEAETGLPIPLGAVIARRELDLAGLSATIRRSVEHAWADPADSRDYVRSLAQELDPAVVEAHIALYVTGSTRQLGAEDLAAAHTLLVGAAGLGLVPALAPGSLGAQAG